MTIRRTLAFALVAALLPLAPFAATPASAAPVSDVVIAAGHTDAGSYNLMFNPQRGLVEDTDNFGPTGTVVVDSLTIKPETATVTAAYLADVHIFYDGWVSDSTWTAPELDAIDDWVTAGGIAIINEDRTDTDALGAMFGAPTAGSMCCDSGTMTAVGLTHPIIDGPFGKWTTVDNAGTVGNLGTVSGDWTVIARDESNQDGIATRSWGDGHVILTADEGIFRTNLVPGANETFALNVFAYAISLTDDGAGSPPLVLTDPGDQVHQTGDIVFFAVENSGGDGSTVSFSADILPSGVVLDPDSGELSGSPVGAGTTTTTITGTPVTGAPDSETFDWIVAQDLFPSPVDDHIEGIVGEPVSSHLCSNDTLGDAPTVASLVGALPAGLVFADCTISGTPAATASAMLSYELTDGDGDIASAALSIEIGPVPPVEPPGCTPDELAHEAPDAGDGFGAALAAGDFNGDGRTDVAVGAPGDRRGAGSVTVFEAPCGPNDGTRITQAGATPGKNENGDGFGSALVSGDFNGDGFADLAIGAPGEDLGRKADAGTVTVLYGSSIGLSNDGALLVSQRGAVPGKPQADDRLGSALAAGDFNGDGVDDLLIGSPGEDINGKVDAGAVIVVFGDPAGLTLDGSQILSQRGAVWGSPQARDRFGFAIAAGDLDGDGFDDAVVGAPLENMSAKNTGVVHVLRGSLGGLTSVGQQRIPGAAKGDRMGWALAVGEVTGDSTDDLIVTALGSDKAGTVHLYSGSPAGLALVDTIDQSSLMGSASSAHDRFGSALSIGDLSGDGVGEVAIGVPRDDFLGLNNAGRVHVVSVVGSRFSVQSQQVRSEPATGWSQAGAKLGSALAIADSALFAGAPDYTLDLTMGSGVVAGFGLS